MGAYDTKPSKMEEKWRKATIAYHWIYAILYILTPVSK